MKAEIKILVIDDESSMRELISKILERAGCSVITAPDGESGLRIALKSRFDVVILDLAMPDIHGIDVCRALRQSPETALIPVIIVSGSLNEETKLECELAGASDCLKKPFNASILIQCVMAHASAQRNL